MPSSLKDFRHQPPGGKPKLRLFLLNHTHLGKQATNNEANLVWDSLLPLSNLCLWRQRNHSYRRRRRHDAIIYAWQSQACTTQREALHRRYSLEEVAQGPKVAEWWLKAIHFTKPVPKWRIMASNTCQASTDDDTSSVWIVIWRSIAKSVYRTRHKVTYIELHCVWTTICRMCC